MLKSKKQTRLLQYGRVFCYNSDMDKKVLIFSTAYHPFIGGAEVAVKEITDRLSRKASDGEAEFQFDMITARMNRGLSKFEKVGNVNVFRVGWGLGFLDKFSLPFLGYFKAKKLHGRNNYDLTWSIMASQASIAASFFKKKFPAVKLVLTLQEGDEEEHFKRYVFGNDILYKILIRPWHLLIFKNADRTTAISEYLKKRAVKNGVKDAVEIVPNGADIGLFSREYPEDELTELKKELGKGPDDKFIITTSRLVKKNAVDDLIKSLIVLGGYFKILVVGDGPDMKKLRKLAKEIGAEKRVFFLGRVNYEDVPKYLKISDIFVRPSLSEGMGNSFIEAMAAGIPVIGTPVGGIVDFIKNGETGLFCDVKSPKSIADKVMILVQNKSLSDRMVVSAKKMVVEKYDWNLVAQKMKNALSTD
ncbi:MAG: hypothetical protein COV00_02000 [Candidatus Tagabacteria bacterium CG10_big_fil_rev_8_21_14_0_10_40_13]|uniref:Glycosyl transferase family 1 domain-containing protein n=2 Tax=Candidatus Tagaibacteriota TaxID=1817918 RepID=A0A2M8L8Z6_9BACT|nr:MAG: hypothetical protein COV00_02000 [Candidatus Tagabacteria bacterium CG10_big_fil_rev_8_21_14_0_10_40_13]